jgi:predicted SnoaL-like aldol condensation-catalyzing enzyme
MTDDSSIEARKQTALAFLQEGRAGNRAALEQLVHPAARHHNPYFPAGMPALLDAMVSAATQAPERSSTVHRVIGEGDHVAVHSHVRPHPGHAGFAVVHLFRFEEDRIVELWDVGQPVPEQNPNDDGMF